MLAETTTASERRLLGGWGFQRLFNDATRRFGRFHAFSSFKGVSGLTEISVFPIGSLSLSFKFPHSPSVSHNVIL